MKKLLIIILLCSCSSCFSQSIRAFGTINAHLTGNFERKSITNFGAGIEIETFNFLRPEIEATYYLGFLEDIENINSNNVTTDLLSKYVSAINYSLTPKFLIDISENDDKGRVYFQIMPKYNLTNITAKATFFTLKKENTNLIETDSDQYKEKRQSFGIGLGVIFNLYDKRNDALAFNLYYNNINIGNAINNLKLGKSSINTSTAFGVGVNYYFGIINKKNKK